MNYYTQNKCTIVLKSPSVYLRIYREHATHRKSCFHSRCDIGTGRELLNSQSLSRSDRKIVTWNTFGLFHLKSVSNHKLQRELSKQQSHLISLASLEIPHYQNRPSLPIQKREPSSFSFKESAVSITKGEKSAL